MIDASRLNAQGGQEIMPLVATGIDKPANLNPIMRLRERDRSRQAAFITKNMRKHPKP